MASPQLEDGFTRIVTALLEALAGARLPGRHLAVMLALIRETYGWNQREAPVPSSRLEVLTGLRADGVRACLGDLRRWHLVRHTSRGRGRPALLGPQKDFEHWAVPVRGERPEAVRRRTSRGEGARAGQGGAAALPPTQVSLPEPALPPTQVSLPEPVLPPTQVSLPEPVLPPTQVSLPEPVLPPTQVSGGDGESCAAGGTGVVLPPTQVPVPPPTQVLAPPILKGFKDTRTDKEREVAPPAAVQSSHSAPIRFLTWADRADRTDLSLSRSRPGGIGPGPGPDRTEPPARSATPPPPPEPESVEPEPELEPGPQGGEPAGPDDELAAPRRRRAGLPSAPELFVREYAERFGVGRSVLPQEGAALERWLADLGDRRFLAAARVFFARRDDWIREREYSAWCLDRVFADCDAAAQRRAPRSATPPPAPGEPPRAAPVPRWPSEPAQLRERGALRELWRLAAAQGWVSGDAAGGLEVIACAQAALRGARVTGRDPLQLLRGVLEPAPGYQRELGESDYDAARALQRQWTAEDGNPALRMREGAVADVSRRWTPPA